MPIDVTITSLEVTAGFGQNFLKFTYDDNTQRLPSYGRLKEIRLYHHTANDRGPDGALLATHVLSAGAGETEAVHVISTGAAGYYWAQGIDASGGVSAWHPSSQTGGVEVDATASIEDDGYVELPGGLIFQWGSDLILSGQHNQITFPVAFPRRVFWAHAFPSAIDNDPSDATWEVYRFHQVLVTGWTNTIVGMVCRKLVFQASGPGNAEVVDHSPGVGVFWFALGA